MDIITRWLHRRRKGRDTVVLTIPKPPYDHDALNALPVSADNDLARDHTVPPLPAPGKSFDSACQTSPPPVTGSADNAGPERSVAGQARCSDQDLIRDDDSQLGPLQGQPYNNMMYGPPRPPCDAERLATASELLQMLDAAPDEEIDNLLRLVCDIFQSPAALVALFDDKRVYIRNTHGTFSRGDFPWRSSFCAWSLAPKNAEIMVIEDSLQDKRFCNNQFVVGPPGVRFYCGSPLLASNGHRLGTICFIDTKPRKFDAGSARLLNNFAELVVRQLEKDLALAMLKKQEAQRLHQEQHHAHRVYAQMLRALDACTSAVMLLDTSVPGWPLLHLNHEAEGLTGLHLEEHGQQPSVKDSFQLHSRSRLTWAVFDAGVERGEEFEIQGITCRKDANRGALDLHFRPAQREPLDSRMISVGVPSNLSMEPVRVGLYFVSISPHEDSGPAAAAAVQQQLALQDAPAGGSIRYDQSMVADHLPGLELGMLLGRGAHGAVYYGHWYGTQVAVKVLHSRGADGQARLEAMLSQQLHHPHILHTHCWAVIPYDKSLSGGSTDQQASDSSTQEPSTPSMADAHSPAAPHPSLPARSAQQGAAQHVQVAPSVQGIDADSWAEEEDGALGDSTSSGGWASPDNRGSSEIWMVMDFCDRGTLEAAIDRGWMHDPPISQQSLPTPHLDQVLATAYEVASAMVYLHAKCIIHGDLTAANVLLTSTGADSASGRGFVAKVADFGLAHDLGPVRSRINTLSYGAVTHMPPELLNNGELSRATDVYSFGVMLWMMYTGSRPWAGLSHSQVINLVCNLQRKLRLPGCCPPPYQALVERCMHFEADRRPTFCEVRTELENIIAQLSDWQLGPDTPDREDSGGAGQPIDSRGFASDMRALEHAGVVQSF